MSIQPISNSPSSSETSSLPVRYMIDRSSPLQDYDIIPIAANSADDSAENILNRAQEISEIRKQYPHFQHAFQRVIESE